MSCFHSSAMDESRYRNRNCGDLETFFNESIVEKPDLLKYLLAAKG